MWMPAHGAQSKTLTPEEESQLIQVGQSNTPLRDEALTRLFESGMPLIKALATETHRRTPDDVLYDDLEAAAFVGYLLAIQHFNRSKSQGCRLSTYARLWIQNQLAEEIRRTRWSVGIPERTYKLLGSVMTCVGKLTSQLQRSPTTDELAADLHIDVTEVRRILAWGERDALSLEAPRGDKGDVCLADLITGFYFYELDDAGTSDVVPSEAEYSFFAEQLYHCIEQLPPTLKQVLRLRFGLHSHGSDGQRTRREVATEIGVSQERARQLEVAALERLQQMPEFRRITTDYVKGRRRPEQVFTTNTFCGRVKR